MTIIGGNAARPSEHTSRRRLRQWLNRLFFRCGLFALFHRCRPGRLTVLAYHRIAEWDDPTFTTLRGNVSATPEGFAAQMDLAAAWFNPVSLDQVVDWLEGGQALPPYPLLVTFDDGYADNRAAAWPILRAHGIPVSIFLATGHIDAARPFFWDLAAHLFARTVCSDADLPLLGERVFASANDKTRTAGEWIAAAKSLPTPERDRAVEDLSGALGLRADPSAFDGLHLTWTDVAEMAQDGVAFGAHTVSHQILSRVCADRVRAEVADSMACIEARLGRRPRAFAYPNGGPEDFAARDEVMLAELGIGAAFTLLPGPQSLHSARRDPMRLRRIIVSRGDGMAQFAAKICGADVLFDAAARGLRQAAACRQRRG